MGAPAGHSLLFAVGAGSPHDGLRKARRLNLSHDLAGVPLAGSGLSTRSPRPSSPTGTIRCALLGRVPGVGSPSLFRRPRGPRPITPSDQEAPPTVWRAFACLL